MTQDAITKYLVSLNVEVTFEPDGRITATLYAEDLTAELDGQWASPQQIEAAEAARTARALEVRLA